jgi:hypothetical protein
MTSHLPEEPEEVWVDAEIVGPNEGPRPPWGLDWDEAVRQAQEQTYRDFAAMQFSLAEQAAFFANAFEEHEKQNRLKIIKRYMWVWWSMLILYGLCAWADFSNGNTAGGAMFVAMAVFGLWMLLYNKRKKMEILRGR